MISTNYQDLQQIKNLDKDHIIFYVLNMLHQGKIGMHAAYDICEECGIFESGRLTIEYNISTYLQSLK